MIEDKKLTRQFMRQRLQAMPASVWAVKSAAVRANVQWLLTKLCAAGPSCLGGYAAIPGMGKEEPDLAPLFQAWGQKGWPLGMPDFRAGAMGFFETQLDQMQKNRHFGMVLQTPDEQARPVLPDAMVIPGLSFCPHGASQGIRLGRGGGHFDRYLAGQSRPLRVGVCFSEQIADELPVEAHDQKMHYIVTDQNIWHCRGEHHGS